MIVIILFFCYNNEKGEDMSNTLSGMLREDNLKRFQETYTEIKYNHQEIGYILSQYVIGAGTGVYIGEYLWDIVKEEKTFPMINACLKYAVSRQDVKWIKRLLQKDITYVEDLLSLVYKSNNKEIIDLFLENGVPFYFDNKVEIPDVTPVGRSYKESTYKH